MTTRDDGTIFNETLALAEIDFHDIHEKLGNLLANNGGQSNII